MWKKWEQFCEWNVKDYHEHPKTRVALLAALTVGTVVLARKVQRDAVLDHENYMRSRGVNVD